MIRPSSRRHRRHGLPPGVFGFVWQATAGHQLCLVGLAVLVFLLTTAPLELQRRIVNQVLAKGDGAVGAFETVILLCGAYVGVALLAGLIKLGFNVYRSWVGENTVRILRSVVYDRAAGRHDSAPHSAAEEGVSLSVVLAEVEPVGGFAGTILSEPLLQAGIMLSVFGYMLVLQPWIAVLAFALFLPQVVAIPAAQRAINKRAEERICTLRAIGTQMVEDWPAAVTGWHPATYHAHVVRVFALNMQIYVLKYALVFGMNLMRHLGAAGVLLIGGWYVLEHRIEVGTVVAFLSGLSNIRAPWGDLVDYYRDMSVARVKYRLIASVFGDATVVDLAATPGDGVPRPA
jgi:ABC-type multidrug transport system fused ATPase/permease subunit